MNNTTFSRFASRFLLPAILAVEVLLFLRFLNAGPIGDDDDEMAYVQGATSFRQLLRTDCYGLFRPIKNILFFLAARMSPSALWPRHILSLVLFMLCTALVFAWLKRRFRHEGWALAGTAAWALAPTQISALAWFSCANILFGAACVLGCMLLHERLPSLNGRPRTLTLAAIYALYALAAVSYESFLVLPVLLLLVDLADGRPVIRRQSLAPFACLIAVAAGCLVARHLVQGHYTLRNTNFGPISPIQLSFASAWLTLDHLRVFLWPFGQQRITSTFVWGVTAPVWQLAASWGVLAAIGLAAWSLRKRAALVGSGVGWFFVSFLPTSNLLPLRSGPYGDYYLVLPSLGLAVALTALVRLAAESAAQYRPAVWIAAGWRFACVALAFGWAGAWNSEEALWSRTLEARPDAFTVRAELARVRLTQGKLDEAESLATLARRQAPWQEHACYVLADVALRRGQADRAAALYAESARVYPNGVYPYFGLGYIQEVYRNDLPGAEASYRRVLDARWNQSSAGAAQNLCRVLLKGGRVDEAVQTIESALARQPWSAELNYSAAVAWKLKGDLPRAQARLDRYNQIMSTRPLQLARR